MNSQKDAIDNKDGSKLLVKEVFFDFEGTLVDFQWQLSPAVEECLTALGNIGFERQWFGSDPSYAFIYNHTRSIVLKSQGQPSIEGGMAAIDAIYDRYDADALTRWNVYPDTLQTLELLSEKGFQMGIISNVGRVALRAAMDRLDLTDRIAITVSRDDVQMLKPDPEGLLQAAGALDVAPAQCLFIGDSRNDVGAARKAGMLAGYLTGGEDSPEDMVQHKADIDIDRLGMLPILVERSR
jgi:HAD superfamily hydrolase (TIGR01509 family)